MLVLTTCVQTARAQMQQSDSHLWLLASSDYVFGNLESEGTDLNVRGFSAGVALDYEINWHYSIELGVFSQNFYDNDRSINLISPRLLAKYFIADGVSVGLGGMYSFGFRESELLDNESVEGYFSGVADIKFELHSGWFLNVGRSQSLTDLKSDTRLNFYHLGIGYRF
jgi:hypothetical protein